MPKICILTALLCLMLVLVPAVVAQEQAEPICPLTEQQTQKSMDTFAKLFQFFTTEPRCVNCHGAVNPYIDGTGSDPEDPGAPPSFVEHGGGKVAHEKDSAQAGLVDAGCAGCHSHMAPRANGSPSVWMTAPSFLSFVGKDAPALCKQVKSASKSATQFLGHMENDNGGNNFTGTAYNGDRGLDRTMYPENEVPTQRPRVSHAELMRMAQDWVDAMGGEFKGNRECGCVPMNYALRFSAETVVQDEDTHYKSVLSTVDVPIKFEDEGAFHGQAIANFAGSGTAGDCAMQAAVSYSASVAGTATETEKEHSVQAAVKFDSPQNASASLSVPRNERKWRTVHVSTQ